MRNERTIHDVGALLRRLRNTKRVSQKEAAESMGMAASTLCRYERGMQPSPADAHRLAAYYERPVEDFWVPPTIPANSQPRKAVGT